MDSGRLQHFVEHLWNDSIVPELVRYIGIPNKSSLFDPQWQEHGFMDQAVELARNWCQRQGVAGLTVEVVRLPGRTPLLFLEVPGQQEGCVLLYGHLDKQPEMSGWREGLGAWQPVIEGDRLYGRGGADDGYAVFASLGAILGLRAQGASHPRCVIVIECCEESGSHDLPHYIEALADRIGTPTLIVCLDSGCGNYDQLWCTTSLRGLVNGDLSVRILTEGVHSGDAGGIVPSSFRILRQLLSRIEDEVTGEVLPRELHAQIPAQRVEQARQAAAILGNTVYERFPFIEGARPAHDALAELVLNRTWRPALEITGAAGLPPLPDAGNVLRPVTTCRLSLRLPPTVDAESSARRLKTLLEADPPHGAVVRFEPEQAASGWHAPPLDAALAAAVDSASRAYFGRPAAYIGEGGSIPFMAMLGEKFPRAQFLITGVLGPQSNAHGPNEFLHIPTGKKLTCCVASILAQMELA